MSNINRVWDALRAHNVSINMLTLEMFDQYATRPNKSEDMKHYGLWVRDDGIAMSKFLTNKATRKLLGTIVELSNNRKQCH